MAKNVCKMIEAVQAQVVVDWKGLIQSLWLLIHLGHGFVGGEEVHSNYKHYLISYVSMSDNIF